MKKIILGITLSISLVFFVVLVFVSCQSDGKARAGFPATGNNSQNVNYNESEVAKTGWPSALPKDSVQPWETLDSNGYIIPAVKQNDEGNKTSSAINLETDFTPGVERYIEAGDVTDSTEASRFASGIAGDKGVSYAMYRVPMGTAQPGAISLDVNLRSDSNGSKSKYYVGISNYEHNTWKWMGSFNEPDIRLIVPAGDYTSELGNTFIAIAAYNGSNFDVVCVGVNARDESDTTAPDALTSAPDVTQVLGGVQIEWNPVIADDLAGYRVYTANRSFETNGDIGVRSLTYIEGGTRIVIPSSGETFIRVASIDVSGNESAPSDIASAIPSTGDAISVLLETDINSGTHGATAELTATGAESYDFDLDGDGIFDITGNTTGTAQAVMDNSGIIRPLVRGTTVPGGIAFSAVSLIISSNSRPVANAQANPSFGQAPLSVDFSGIGEDEDGTITSYAWDFDGDGNYDSTFQNISHSYNSVGLYNAKLRVQDNNGAWDVDTVAILVNAPDDPANVSPSADIQADVTSGNVPLTVNFSAAASTDSDGTIALLEWDFNSDGIYDGYGTDATISHTYTAAGTYTAKLRITDNGGARDVTGILIDVNALPVASLTATPPGCETGETIRYDASESGDPDGSISNYWWDLDNDGIFSEVGAEENAMGASFVEVVYPESGHFYVTVRVIDNSTPTGTADADNDVYVHGWSIASPNPDSDGDLGAYTSLAVINGFPAISYLNSTNTSLCYVRASNADGSAWGTPITVDNAGDVGVYTSLAVVNGFPAISYYDTTNSDLKYVRATDADGSIWGTPVTVVSTEVVGSYCSLAVVNGYPAISYLNSTNTSLCYVRASNADGSAWGTPITVDNAGDVGYNLSFAVVNGFPAISYYDSTNGDLKYVHATDADGSIWGTPVTVVSAEVVGMYSSLAVVNGFPAISYLNSTNTSLCYVRASNADGSAWGTPITVDNAGDVGYYLSFAVVNGYPAVSYFDTGSVTLKYVRAAATDGSLWEKPVIPDSTGNVGRYTSLVVLDGCPAISYRDEGNDDLKFVRLY